MNPTSRLHSTSLRRPALVTLIAGLALLLLLVAGPTPRADANPPFDLEVVTGINYSGSPGPALDLYVPDFPGNARLPLLIWSNGCAWLAPDCGRSGAEGIAGVFNPQGYAVAGVGLRSSSQARFPAQLFDIRSAIRWLREHAADYNLDPNRFAIMGFSSGGWTSVMAGTTSDEAALPGEPNTNGLANGVSSAVQAAVGFSSPTDFLEMDPWYAANCPTPPGPVPPCSFITHDAPVDMSGDPAGIPLPGFFPAASPESLLVGCTDPQVTMLLSIRTPECEDKTQAANPIEYVEGSEVPMLLLHGFLDPLVPHGQSELLYEALAAAGNEVTFVSVDTAGHNVNGPPGFAGPPIIGAEEFTAYHTNRGGQEIVTTKLAPTWETIEHFIHGALSRARGR